MNQRRTTVLQEWKMKANAFIHNDGFALPINPQLQSTDQGFLVEAAHRVGVWACWNPKANFKDVMFTAERYLPSDPLMALILLSDTVFRPISHLTNNPRLLCMGAHRCLGEATHSSELWKLDGISPERCGFSLPQLKRLCKGKIQSSRNGGVGASPLKRSRRWER